MRSPRFVSYDEPVSKRENKDSGCTSTHIVERKLFNNERENEEIGVSLGNSHILTIIAISSGETEIV